MHYLTVEHKKMQRESWSFTIEESYKKSFKMNG